MEEEYPLEEIQENKARFIPKTYKFIKYVLINKNFTKKRQKDQRYLNRIWIFLDCNKNKKK